MQEEHPRLTNVRPFRTYADDNYRVVVVPDGRSPKSEANVRLLRELEQRERESRLRFLAQCGGLMTVAIIAVAVGIWIAIFWHR